MQRLRALAWTSVRKFIGERRSDTAVEFALIGSVLFLFVFGIFVVAIDQFWQMTLDDAVRAAARKVQIGAITASSTPSFVAQVCAEFGVAAPNCAATLQYSVQGGTSFSGMTPAVLGANGTLTGSVNFTGVTATTQPSAAVGSTPAVLGVPQYLLVQVAYLLPFRILLAAGGVATENGTPALLSVVATAME